MHTRHFAEIPGGRSLCFREEEKALWENEATFLQWKYTKRKEVTKHKVEGSPFKYSFWHDLSQLFYSFKYYLYQVILDISVLKSKLLLIKMITIDNWNFMTDSRRVFLQGFYASVIMRLTDKKFQPIKNYFLFKKYQYCLLWYNCNCIVEVRAILSKFSVACMCENSYSNQNVTETSEFPI